MKGRMLLAAAVLSLMQSAGLVHAAEDPAADHTLASDQTKAMSESMKHNFKVIADAAKDSAKKVAGTAKEVAHEVAAASKEGAHEIAATAKRGAAGAKAAVHGEKTPIPPANHNPPANHKEKTPATPQ
jgi:hypothetical protein